LRLQDDVPPFSDEQAFTIIAQQLGKPLEAVFSSISEQPVAAASLGQVYKAVLRDSGEEVAVKVQRPGIEPVILRDLFIFRALGSLFNTLSRQVGGGAVGALCWACRVGGVGRWGMG
jgi:predicted unusual protein kinase regulating ubiquinone biosynthesis (AarF/ABC1/UbiB family)